MSPQSMCALHDKFKINKEHCQTVECLQYQCRTHCTKYSPKLNRRVTI